MIDSIMIKHCLLAAAMMIALLGAFPSFVIAQSIAAQTAGYILLDVEQNGEAWYVDPLTQTRTYLARPDDAFALMRSMGLGITTADLEKIPAEGESQTGDYALRQRLAGRILLQVEAHGEAWYVYPRDLKRYYLGRPADAFSIMQRLGLGISSANLALIPIASSTSTPPSDSSEATHTSMTVATDRGSFAIELIRIPRDSYEMVTDTAELSDCSDDCDAQPLANYVSENGGTIGIHGTYFCPPDYSACAGATNSFDPPVYNSAAEVMINEGDLPYHSGPMLVYRADHTYYQYHRASQFDPDDEILAAIANYPSLVEGGVNIVGSETVNSSQQTNSARGGIGFTENEVLLVIAHSASVIDLASIFDALDADYAMNLDGGATAAMYFNGTYVYGPNRQLANAIIWRRR